MGGSLLVPIWERPRIRFPALAVLQALAVVSVAYVIGTESFLVGGAVAFAGLTVTVLMWPAAALPSLTLLYVLPASFTLGGVRAREVVAACFAILMIEWLRTSVVSSQVLIVLLAGAGLLAAILVSAMGLLSQPGMTASLAEVGASLVILAAGVCLGAMRGLRPSVTFIRFLVTGIALTTLVLWVRSGSALGDLGTLAAASRATSAFDNPNFLGTFLAIGAVVIVAPGTRGLPRLAWILAFGLSLAGIAVSGSRGALLVLAAGLGCVVLVRQRKTIKVLLIGAVIASLVTWGIVTLTTARVSGTRQLGISAASIENSPEFRLNAARLALDLVFAQPLTGVGYNQFPRYAAGDPRLNLEFDPHNEYLRVAAESGVLALLLLLTLVGSVVWAGVRYARGDGGALAAAGVSAVAAYGISLLTIQGLRSFQFSAPWMLLAGVIVGAAARERKTRADTASERRTDRRELGDAETPGLIPSA